MAERNLDFDTVVDRRGTNCLKYDFAERRGKAKDIMPLWVADMDFKISSYIQDAIEKQTVHGIFGYSESTDSYAEAYRQWAKKHYNWDVNKRWLVKTPGVVFALATAIKEFTKKRDAVLIQQPVYYPFSEVILDNERKLVSNTLVQGEDGKYKINFKDFEQKIVQENIKLFILCNPHNPVGRVWKKEELEKIGKICKEHNVIVVSDEIHADFVFEGRHEVFANINEDFKDFTITCTSPSKTFNIAGLQVSNIWISNPSIRRRFRHRVAAAGYSQINTLGIVACEAAYKNGEEWYEAVIKYIKSNIDYVKKFIDSRIPQIRYIKPEGTYLLWLDFKNLNLTDQELEELIEKKAGLWLDGGSIFGESGKGFQRINAACPRSTLTMALEKLERAINEISNR